MLHVYGYGEYMFCLSFCSLHLVVYRLNISLFRPFFCLDVVSAVYCLPVKADIAGLGLRLEWVAYQVPFRSGNSIPKLY